MALNDALIQYIDAAMPADADFVDYKLTDDERELEIQVACGAWGDELSLDRFAHIATALKQLGVPDIDFDGESAINEIGTLGWARTTPQDPERVSPAQHTRDQALVTWLRARDATQTQALKLIRDMFPTDAEAMDFAGDAWAGLHEPVAVITAEGRQDAQTLEPTTMDSMAVLAPFIQAPDRARLAFNELTGTYRLDRRTEVDSEVVNDGSLTLSVEDGWAAPQ